MKSTSIARRLSVVGPVLRSFSVVGLLTSLSSFGMDRYESLNLPLATIYTNRPRSPQRSPRQENNSENIRFSFNTKERPNQNNSQTHFLRKSGDVHRTVYGESNTLHCG
jgi:hypothetical protein